MVISDSEIFEDSLRVTRASFHPKETNAEYYAMQSKMKKYRKIGDTFVNIKMDDSYHQQALATPTGDNSSAGSLGRGTFYNQASATSKEH